MPYQAYTLSDLKVKMEARWDSTPFWDDTEAKNALNEALWVWNSMTGFWKAPVDLTTTANEDTYDLPESLVFGLRVEYNRVPLAPTSTFDMDQARPGWENTPASSPRVWMPVDLTTIRVWPAPAVSGSTLTIDGVAATPILNYDADFIEVGSDTIGLLLGYALHAVALKEGGDRFQATMPYFEQFLAAAAELNNQLTKSELFRHFLGTDQKRQENPTR